MIEYWQIVSNKTFGSFIYRYQMDQYEKTIFHYSGCIYNCFMSTLDATYPSFDELILKAAIRGNVKFFKLKKLNCARGVVFENEMEFMSL